MDDLLAFQMDLVCEPCVTPSFAFCIPALSLEPDLCGIGQKDGIPGPILSSLCYFPPPDNLTSLCSPCPRCLSLLPECSWQLQTELCRAGISGGWVFAMQMPTIQQCSLCA